MEWKYGARFEGSKVVHNSLASSTSGFPNSLQEEQALRLANDCYEVANVKSAKPWRWSGETLRCIATDRHFKS